MDKSHSRYISFASCLKRLVFNSSNANNNFFTRWKNIISLIYTDMHMFHNYYTSLRKIKLTIRK